MTTDETKCPKCGADPYVTTATYTQFSCNAIWSVSLEKLIPDDRCRLRELTTENARLKAAPAAERERAATIVDKNRMALLASGSSELRSLIAGELQLIASEIRHPHERNE